MNMPFSAQKHIPPFSRQSRSSRRVRTVSTALVSLATCFVVVTAPQATAEPLTVPRLDGSQWAPFADSPSATSLITPEQRKAGLAILNQLPSSFNADDSFYVPPAQIPQEAGAIIRQAEAQDVLGSAAGGWPAKAQRILFTSTTSLGDKVATSALLMEPKSKWIGDGERPTVVIAPGTRGAADVCAPSRGLMLAGGMNADTMAIGVNYELPIAYLAAAAGARVILTDYIGLGTPGPHTYVNHEEEGNAVLDAARAGLTAAGAPADSPIGFWGYSQGGGATAAAAERANAYAPELNIRGVYAGAPPADLLEVMNAVDGNAIVGVLGMALHGMAQRFPDIQTDVIDSYLNDDGKRFVRETSKMCIPDAIAAWGGRSTRNLTTTGETLGELARRIPAAHDELSRQQLGQNSLPAPMLVQSGTNDDTVPYPQARKMATDYCSNGENITFWTDPLPKLVPGSAANHATTMIGGLPQSLTFLFDRFNDEPTQGNCGQF